METKICRTCNKEKELSEFNKFVNSIDGYKHQCRECQKEESKNYYKENKFQKHLYYQKNKETISKWYKNLYRQSPEYYKAKASLYYKENKEKALKTNKTYREKNREEVLQKKREAWREQQAEKKGKEKEFLSKLNGPFIPPTHRICIVCGNLKSLETDFGIKNPRTKEKFSWCKECFKKWRVDYRIKNKDKIKEYDKKRTLLPDWKEKTKKWRKTPRYIERTTRDRQKPQRIIAQRCRSRIIGALKIVGANKTMRSSELVGCSWWYLEAYLRATMTDNMNWKMFLNGDLAMDHIRPLCSFNLLDSEQLHEAFHYTNLRLLHHTDNSAKATEDKKKSINKQNEAKNY